MTDPIEPVQAGLHHQVVPPRIQAARYPVLVLLHGRGHSAAGMAPVALEFGRDDLLVISAQGPLPLGAGYEGFDISEAGQRDQPTLSASLAALAEFLETVAVGYPIDSTRVILQGFSQGAVMALGILGLRPELVAGVIALSGFFPPAVEPRVGGLQGCAAFLAHGLDDDTIPVDASRKTRDLLVWHGVDLTYREYPMAHHVNAEEMAEARSWLNHLLGQIGPPTTP